jgi:hypothetical protein
MRAVPRAAEVDDRATAEAALRGAAAGAAEEAGEPRGKALQRDIFSRCSVQLRFAFERRYAGSGSTSACGAGGGSTSDSG